MNITFLIGNGFDIGLGAPTRYTDFYQWLLNTARGKPLLEKKNEKEVESPLKKVMDSIESNYELWADLEVARGKYPQYLLNQQRVLQKDLEYPLYVKEKLIEKKLIEQLNKSFDALDNALGEYLALVEKDYQLSYASDKENELFYETDKENEFHRALLNFFADFSETEKLNVNELLGHLPDTLNYQFIDFNFTEYLDKIIDYFGGETTIANREVMGNTYQSIVNKPLHVHGSLRKKDFILGVDNKTQFIGPAKVVAALSPYHVKSALNHSLGNKNEEKAKQLIDNSIYVCIYGMSLGATDLTWWKYIFSWLKKQKDNHLVLFHYNDGPRPVAAQEKIRLWDNVKKLFFSIVEATFEESEKYKSQIIVCVNSSIFNFRTIKVMNNEKQAENMQTETSEI